MMICSNIVGGDVVIDEELIDQYMNLDRKINKANMRLIRRRTLFYAQTLNSYITTDGMKIYSKGFSIENNVIDFVDNESLTKKYIEVLTFKQKHFKSFFDNLSINKRKALQEKYQRHTPMDIEMAEKQCMIEINEIEEACKYKYKNDLEIDSFIEKIDEAVLALNNDNDFENSFEDSFQRMFEALEVIE